MKDYLPVISAILSGFFLLASAFIAWKLKVWSEGRERSLGESKGRREDLKQLYTDVFVMLEQSIKAVVHHEEFNLHEQLSRVNARVRLIASTEVGNRYQQVAELLKEWSILHVRASPRCMQVGDQAVVVIQSPDPTALYKEPEREAHRKLQEAIEILVAEMRAELAKGA